MQTVEHTERGKDTSILGLLGLAIRARKVKGGATAAEAVIRAGRAQLVLLARDSADNTQRQFRRLANLYGIPLLEQHTMDEYGDCTQSAPRAVLVVTDRHLAAGMLKKAESGVLRTESPNKRGRRE